VSRSEVEWTYSWMEVLEGEVIETFEVAVSAEWMLLIESDSTALMLRSDTRTDWCPWNVTRGAASHIKSSS